MSEQTPRINAPFLERSIGLTVRIIGKVLQLRGESAMIDATGQVLVHLNPDTHWALGHTVEIIGKVQQDLTIKVLGSIDLGTNIDMNAVEAVVDVCHRYKELFYDS